MLPPVVQFTWEDHYLQSCLRMESVATLSFFEILQAHPILLEPDLTRILKLYTCMPVSFLITCQPVSLIPTSWVFPSCHLFYNL